MSELSTMAEITIGYALLTVGTSPTESVILRQRCADALREMGHRDGAEQVENHLASVKA